MIPDKATVTVNVQQPHGVWDVKQRFTATILYKEKSCVVNLVLFKTGFRKSRELRIKFRTKFCGLAIF